MAKDTKRPKPAGNPLQNVCSGDLFHGLTDRECGIFLDNARFSEYEPKCWIYHQGDLSQHVFFLESGLVRLSQLMPEGAEVLVGLVGPGEIFGYSSLISRSPSLNSAQTMQKTKLLTWERRLAVRLLHSIPRAGFNFFTLAVRDVTFFSDRASRLQTQPVGKRVEWAVAEFARRFGATCQEGIVISDGIGHREIADLAGTTIFTVSRELSRLERESVLRKERGRIFVQQFWKPLP